MKNRVLSVAVAFVFIAALNLAAQEASERVPTKEEIQKLVQIPVEELAKLGPENKAFHGYYDGWIGIIKELQALKLEYQTAKPERAVEIQKKYDEIIERGKKVQPELLKLAFAAFKEAPYKNPYVMNYLFGLVEWEYNRENFEKAVEIFQFLEPYGIPEMSTILYAYAGCSAALSMQFDLADKWIDKARTTVDQETEKPVWDAFIKNTSEESQNAILGTLGPGRLPELKKEWEAEQEIRKSQDAETDPEKMLPRVLFKTSKGDIVLELFEDEAPNTVANFVSLVEKGFYSNVVFHRVLPFFMAQGGDPTGTGGGGPGYCIDCECYKPSYRKHFRGSISMANAGRDTNGSQFFLTTIPTSFLNGRHTVFGRIVEGIDVLAEIKRINPDDDSKPEPDKIIEAKVLRSRPHKYEPVKNNKR